MADTRRGLQLGRRFAPPRFIAFVLLMAAGTVLAAWPLRIGVGRALLAGFDVASVLFLLSLSPLLGDETHQMRRRAAENDANRVLLLLVTGAVMIVVLVAVGSEVAGKPTHATVALVIATLALAWLFSNVVYALHYAHLYYSDADANDKDDGGLDFPNCDEPDYWDFIYFSFTLGMTFQTSDVQIGSRRMRRIVIGHTVAAFVYNLGVIAFTINVLGN